MQGGKYITKPRPGRFINRAHPLSNGLMGYWVMNEGSGTRVNDISGNNYHGAAAANNWSGSPFGGCLAFNGTSDIVSMGNVIDFNTNDFSLSFWVKSSDVNNSYVIAKGVANSGQYIAYFTNDSRFALYIQTNDANWKQKFSNTTVSTFTNGQWHHIVCTRSGASDPTITLYIDGGIDSGTIQGGGTVGSLSNSGDLTFSSVLASPGSIYIGYLDEVRIYNRVLTKEDVNTLYTNPHADIPYSNKWLWKINPSFKFNNQGIRPRPFAPGLAR